MLRYIDGACCVDKIMYLRPIPRAPDSFNLNTPEPLQDKIRYRRSGLARARGTQVFLIQETCGQWSNVCSLHLSQVSFSVQLSISALVENPSPVNSEIVSEISRGLMVLVGIGVGTLTTNLSWSERTSRS